MNQGLNSINLSAEIPFSELQREPDAIFVALLRDAVVKGLVETDSPYETDFITAMLLRGASYMSVQRAPTGLRCCLNVPYIPERFLPLTHKNVGQYALYQMTRPESERRLAVTTTAATTITIDSIQYPIDSDADVRINVREGATIQCEGFADVQTDLVETEPNCFVMGDTDASMSIDAPEMCTMQVQKLSPSGPTSNAYSLRITAGQHSVVESVGGWLQVPKDVELLIEVVGEHADAAVIEYEESFVQSCHITFTEDVNPVKIYLPALLTLTTLTDLKHARLTATCLGVTWIDTDKEAGASYVPYAKDIEIEAVIDEGYYFISWTPIGYSSVHENPTTVKILDGNATMTCRLNYNEENIG